MRPETLAQGLLVLLVGGAVVAGLIVTGGPGQGRAEKRDGQRWRDLRDSAALARCLYEETGAAPEALRAMPGCTPTEIPTDPGTGQPYAFALEEGDQFRICATFETDARPMISTGPDRFDHEAGCLVGRFAP